jgi:hypothetical protein
MTNKIEQNLEKAKIDGAIVRQKLTNVNRHDYNLLGLASLRKISSTALHYELRASMQDAEHKVASSTAAFDSLEREFVSYLAKVPLEDVSRKSIESRGLEYLKDSGGDE